MSGYVLAMLFGLGTQTDSPIGWELKPKVGKVIVVKHSLTAISTYSHDLREYCLVMPGNEEGNSHALHGR